MRVHFVLSIAAVAVSAEDGADDEIDRTDFTEEHMKEDLVAKIAHSEIEAAFILPENPEMSTPCSCIICALCHIACRARTA